MAPTADVPHLADMRITYDDAMDLVAEAALRFEGMDTVEGRRRLAGFLGRLAEALRLPLPDRTAPRLRRSSRRVDGNSMVQLTTLLVRTGRLRSRASRMDLANMCLCAGALLAEAGLTDGLWERWLDRRDLPPSERLRQMWVKSDLLHINGLGMIPELWTAIKELPDAALPPGGAPDVG